MGFFLFCLVASVFLAFLWDLSSVYQIHWDFKPWIKGEELQRYLQFIQTNPGLPKLEENKALPQYKFYTDLLVKILNHSRLLGASYKSILWEWREGIQQDIHHDQEVFQEWMGGVLQFLLMSSMTWIFCIISTILSEIDFSFTTSLWIFILQISGFISWFILFKNLEKKFLTGFNHFFFSLYTLKSLSGVGLSTSQVVIGAQLENLENTPSKLSYLKERIYETSRLFQQKGLPISRENDILIQELWFKRREQLKLMKKSLEMGKLAMLVVFFLPSYFIFIYSLMSSLTSEI